MPSIVALLTVAICVCLPGPYEVSMSPLEQQHAIALLRDAYAAFNRNDIPAAVHALDAHIEWSEPAEFPGGGICHGRTAVARYLASSRAPWAQGASEPVKFIPHGDRIVVFVHARFRLRDSSTWADVSLADVYTFRNGVPIAMRAFSDRNAALQWVGIAARQ